MRSPPGRRICARPKRASNGAASSTVVRIRRANSSSGRPSITPAAFNVQTFAVIRASTPMLRSKASLVRTSPMSGTLPMVSASSVRIDAAKSGSAEFLLPIGAMRPASRRAPSMRK